VYGVGGVSLGDRWKDVPETYLSVATDGFPNYFNYLGPNSGLGTGNLLVLIERLADYFTECTAKIQRDNIATISPKPESVRGFVEHCDKYFERTVFTMNCRSWYKGGTEHGRVSALWPGSSLHAMEALSHPRWEDFEYTYVNANPFGWMGNGWTQNELDKNINVDYLNVENIDFPRPQQVTVTTNGHVVETEQAAAVNGEYSARL